MSQVVRFLTLAGLAALGLASCGDAPTLPVYGYEVDEFACQDGEDNDFDGLIDCRDPECLVFSVLCGEVIPDDDVSRPEDSFLDCFDRIDNDRNGQFDCGDRKCQAIAETCCLREFTNELCSDGLDNDQNGFADCEDFGCRNAKFVTVCEENTPERCSDGIDNNNNARFGEGIDCADEDCTGIGPCAEPGNCDDDVDNDGNGLTDCEDLASCYADPACGNEPGPEDTLETCSDKVDNDGNGFTDCEDFSCSMNPNQQVVLLCPEHAEDTDAKTHH